MRNPLSKPLWAALVLAGLFAACSTEKDAFLNRTFHRLVARDNGWFNAREKLKEVVAGIERDYPENYDEVLPLFIYGTEQQAKAAVPELEKCIEKCSIVIDRHSMEFKDREKNNWIDDAYLVIAQSQFYKQSYFDAQRTSDYIGRKFKGHDQQLTGKLWLARTLIQLEQYARAQTVLDEVRNEKEPPKGFPHDQLSAIQADLDLKRGKVDDAITDLERAIDVAERKKDRVRWSFILAQLYQAKGHEEKAVAQYMKVTRMNPPYELGFHAQIFQALAFDAGNSKALRQKLNRMLKDDKHVDHFDMIHYALADLDLKEGRDSLAIDHLKTSARVSTTDVKQKAKSFLKLADVYFEARRYPNAQQYYDSTQVIMDPEHIRFDEVKTRAEVLGELVEQLEIIAREDSLQGLAELDDKERARIVNRIIREREEEEEARRQREEEARETDRQVVVPGKPPQPAGGGEKGSWYFYNPTAMSRGLAEFKKKWGSRTLEDDWRRKDKSGAATGDLAEEGGGEQGEEGTERKEGEPEWKDPQYYLKDIPVDSAALMASNERICRALYRAGIIYKEKLRDVDNGVESFEMLNSRFDQCVYTPESHYQLYRIYLDKERSQNRIDFSGIGSQTYADIILERWPDSEFARLVRDPDALQADEAHKAIEAAEYDVLYRQFRQGDYLSVIAQCNTVIASEPRNHLLAKYHLLKAMAVGGMHEESAFRNALADVQTKFPGTDEAKAAADILAVLDKKAGSATDPVPMPTARYSAEAGQHYFILVFPNADGDITQVKNKIIAFGHANFPSLDIEVTSSFLDPDNQVVLLSVFESKQKAMEYYDLFLSDRVRLQGINDQGYATFAITPDNYSQLYKSKDLDGYATFFAENYLKAQ